MRFEEVIGRLADAGVEFIVIGRVAMLVHGCARVTQDIDFCYARTPENMRRLATALAPYHARLRGAPEGLPFVFDAETIRSGLNFRLSTDLGDVDLLGEVAGLGTYDSVLAESEKMEQFGRKFYVLSLGGLIRAKRAAGRKRDLDAIRELEALREMRTKPGGSRDAPAEA